MEVTTKKQNRRKIVIGVLIAVVVLVAEALVLELVETVEKVETHNGALEKMEKKEKVAEK